MKIRSYKTISIALLAACIIAAKSFNRVDKEDYSDKKDFCKTKIKNEQKMNELKFDILKDGNGETAAKGDLVTVHYTGWLNQNGELGNKFDSSVDRGEPFMFPLGAGLVIKGWDEGVAGMKIGEKRRLFIPSHMAYGSQEIAGIIPANSDLIFDVELISNK